MNVLVLVVVLSAWTAQAAAAGVLATRKGRSFNVWTLVALIVGPIAILLALVLPQRRLFE
jgi:hypothetical protein